MREEGKEVRTRLGKGLDGAGRARHSGKFNCVTGAVGALEGF